MAKGNERSRSGAAPRLRGGRRYAPAALVLAAGLALALALPAVLLLTRGGGGSDRNAFRGSEPPEGIAAPDFALRDHAGNVVRMDDLRGKAVAITFLDSACTEACPVIAAQIPRALELLRPADRRDVVAVAISVDPKGDTAANVRAFLRRHRAEGELRYLIGSEAALRPVWRSFQVAPSLDTGDSDLHSAPVRVFDTSGEWVATLHAGADLTPANLAHDLSAALRR